MIYSFNVNLFPASRVLLYKVWYFQKTLGLATLGCCRDDEIICMEHCSLSFNFQSIELYSLFLFFYNPGCPGQLACTTTISRVYWTSCKLSRQVRHRGGDRHAHERSNSGRGQGKPHLLTTELDPQVHIELYS